MSREKFRVYRTDTDNLVSNLRGEVGDIVTTWVLHKILEAQIARQSSGDLTRDLADRNLAGLRMICDKLRDTVIGQLSELGQKKVGRLNFHFAARKLKTFDRESAAFSRFVDKNGFTEKRNYDISHKELPETWSDHRYINISDAKIVRAVAMALRLVKRIDRERIGPASRHLWREMRSRRYDLALPGRVAYMLLPYLRMDGDAREKIIREEEAEGKQVWTEMETLVNSRRAMIRVAKEWGLIDLSSIRYLDQEFTSEGDA
jgi:hypothetical protein